MDKSQMEYIQYLHKTLIQNDGTKDKQLKDAFAKERLAIRMATMNISKLNQSNSSSFSEVCTKLPNVFQIIKTEPMETDEEEAVDGSGFQFQHQMAGECQSDNCSSSSQSQVGESSPYSPEKNTIETKITSPRRCPAKMLAKLDGEKLAKARRKFTRMIEEMEEDRERVRQVISEHKYRHYLEVLGRLRENPQHRPNYRESRIANRFGLDANGHILVDQKNGKPFLRYGDMFDSIYQCYLRPRFGGLRAIYAELKRNYANITLECMNIFMLACS